MRWSVAFLLVACAPQRPYVPAHPTVAPAPAPVVLTADNVEPLPEDAPVVAVEGTQVTVDGVMVASTEAVSGTQKIEGAWNALRETRKRWVDAHPGAPFGGLVLVRAPAQTKMRVVRALLLTASMAGYPHAGIVVQGGMVRVGAPMPASKVQPDAVRLRVAITDDEIAVRCFEGTELRRTVNKPRAQFVDGLKDAWTGPPTGKSREWLVALADGDTLSTLVMLLDGIVRVSGEAPATLVD